jgi:hypothetical protein
LDNPKPSLAYTQDEVDNMFGSEKDAYFRIPSDGFWDGWNIWSLKRGSRVLWKSGAMGPNGGDSTKVELFSGLVHDCNIRDEFIILS